MTAYRAGTARVSSTVTKTVGTNPRPRKYATASERQAAYRARAPEVCFRAEAKTVETLDNIADTLDQSRADLLLSMTKFALANHDWARFGLTHRPLPYGYGVQPATNPAPIWKRKRPKSLGKPVPLTPKQKAAAKAMAKAAGRPYPNLVDNIAASRLENPTVKKPTPAQLAARAKFAAMARSGAFKRKAKAKAAPKAKTSAGNYKVMTRDGDIEIEGVTMAQAKKYIADRAKKTKRFAGFWSVVKANPVKKTVSEKISQLVREGYPQKQAVAVALSEERAGKVKRNPAAKIKWEEYTIPGDKTKVYGAVDRGFRATVIKENGVWSMHLMKDNANRTYLGTWDSGNGRVSGAKAWFEVVLDNLHLFPEFTSGRKPNPATGAKKSRTKLNPVRDFYYVVKCGQYYDGQFSSKHYTLDEVKKIAQQKADKYGCPAKITEIH